MQSNNLRLSWPKVCGKLQTIFFNEHYVGRSFENDNVAAKEGPEGVKWDLLILWLGKSDFMHWDWDLAIKTIENGNGIKIKIWAGQPLGRWDMCSWTLGFGRNLG
jgi:hypothetical protein